MIIVQIQPLNLLKLTGIIFINTTVGYRQERGQCEKAVEVYLGQNFDFSNFLIVTMKFSMMFATYPRVCHQINLLQREWKRSPFAKGARGISQMRENVKIGLKPCNAAVQNSIRSIRNPPNPLC